MSALASLALALQLAVSPLMFNTGDPAYQVSAPTTGQTVQVSGSTLLVKPAGTLVALTVNLPGCSAANSGQVITFSSTQAITTLSVTTSAGSVSGGLSTLALGGGQRFICDGASTTWTRIY